MSRYIAVAVLSFGLMAACAGPGGTGASKGTSAAAQRMTVGDLTAKGGKQLSQDEMQQLLAGATLKGSTQHGTWTSTQEADGTYTGKFSRYSGGGRDFNGTWRIDERGRNCNVDKTRPNQSEVCTNYYALDGRYYATDESNPGPTTVLEDRTVTK